MRTRTSYDTSIKHLYRGGLEKLIAPSIRKNIPRSTIHRWRQEKKEKYLGSELNELAKSELLLLKQFVHSRNERRIFMNYVRIGRFIEKISGERVLRKLFAENKAEAIDLIERIKETMPLEQVLRFFNISRLTYNLWILGLYGDCYHSPLNWCKASSP